LTTGNQRQQEAAVPRRIQLTVAYDGTGFHGWQVQPGQATVQAELEAVLGQLEGSPVHVAGSGRTDAGVHALAQVAACSLHNPIPVENLVRAMNKLLPAAIRITAARDVALHFHPRFQAKRKTYEYRIFRGAICSPFECRYLHHHPYPLDIAAIEVLAPLLEGTHDFSAFATADEKDELGGSKVRTIFRSYIDAQGDHLRYRVSGNGFLKHMVRNIVGTLLEGGKGNLDAAGLKSFLEPGHGRKAGPRAPACGLYLVSVEYD